MIKRFWHETKPNRCLSLISRIILLVLILFSIYSSYLIIKITNSRALARDDHLVLLAEQFSHGNLSLSPLGLPLNDYVDYFSRQYLYFGPVSSIILIPFAALWGRAFPQLVVGILSLVVAFVAIYRICRLQKYSFWDSLWLSVFFCFSTVLFAVSIINLSAYQVQALGSAVVLLAIMEFLGKRRLFLVGIIIALAGMTRMTLYLSLVYFVVELFRSKTKINGYLALLIPVIFSLLILAGYNYKRFHSWTETGYKYNVSLSGYPMNINLKSGFLSISHLPTNLYSLLLKSPDPLIENGGGLRLKFPYLKVDPWGIALWFTSPLFLLIFKARRGLTTINCLLTTSVLAIPSLLYFGVGYSQFGYRYSLDFLPFLFLILLSGLKPSLSFVAKFLIILGVLFNCLYMTSIWGIYPQFNIY